MVGNGDEERPVNEGLPTVSAPTPPRYSRRAIVTGLGAIVVAGGAGGALVAARRRQTDPGNLAARPATTLAAAVVTDTPVPTAIPTSTPSPTATPYPTSTPVAAPAFTPHVVTADMSDRNQWNTIAVEQSTRVLKENTYTVSVTKTPAGTTWFSWGDWSPQNVKLVPQFMAEVEMRLTGDPAGVSGGILFLYNSDPNDSKRQFLLFLSRGDGHFSLDLQEAGDLSGRKPLIDWLASGSIMTGTDALNALRVDVAGALFSCYINGQRVAQLPVPAQVIANSGFALVTKLQTESTQRDGSATFRNLRYEPHTDG